MRMWALFSWYCAHPLPMMVTMWEDKMPEWGKELRRVMGDWVQGYPSDLLTLPPTEDHIFLGSQLTVGTWYQGKPTTNGGGGLLYNVVVKPEPDYNTCKVIQQVWNYTEAVLYSEYQVWNTNLNIKEDFKYPISLCWLS